MVTAVLFSEFNNELREFAAYIAAHADRLRITTEQNAELQAEWTAWRAAFVDYPRPDNTHLADDSRSAISLPQRAESSARLAPASQAHLQIAVDRGRPHRPAHQADPGASHARRLIEMPVNTVRATKPGVVEFSTKSSRPTQHTRLPPGVREIMREVAYLTTGTIPQQADFHAIDAATHAHHSIRLPAAVRGKGLVGWLRTRYANSRGESGAPSDATQFAVI